MKSDVRKKMGDKHEADVAEWLGGRLTRGSGNQWKDTLDGKSAHYDRWCFGWDCKSTLAASLGVTRSMWAKAVEQSDGERTLIPIRFYDTERLAVGLDLIVVGIDDFIEMKVALDA